MVEERSADLLHVVSTEHRTGHRDLLDAPQRHRRAAAHSQSGCRWEPAGKVSSLTGESRRTERQEPDVSFRYAPREERFPPLSRQLRRSDDVTLDREHFADPPR